MMNLIKIYQDLPHLHLWNHQVFILIKIIKIFKMPMFRFPEHLELDFVM